MIKKYFLLVVLLVSSLKMSAQFSGYGFCYDCYWSIEAGMAVSGISGIEGATAKEGFYVGILSYHPLDYDKFDLRTGISYTSVRSKIEGFKNPLLIHSINFPITFHYRPTGMFQVFGGGEIGTNFFGRLPSNVDNPNSLDNADFNENFTLLDAGVLLGGGIILFDGLDINLTYTLGVTNISKAESENWKKNILRLSVGYTFRDW